MNSDILAQFLIELADALDRENFADMSKSCLAKRLIWMASDPQWSGNSNARKVLRAFAELAIRLESYQAVLVDIRGRHKPRWS